MGCMHTWIIEHRELDWKRIRCPIVQMYGVSAWPSIECGFHWFFCTSGTIRGLFWGLPLVPSDQASTGINCTVCFAPES